MMATYRNINSTTVHEAMRYAADGSNLLEVLAWMGGEVVSTEDGRIIVPISAFVRVPADPGSWIFRRGSAFGVRNHDAFVSEFQEVGN